MEGLLQADHHPSYFLFLQIDPAKIDVNINPTKTEIKFEDEKLIYSLVKSSVKKSLEKFNISPSINFDADVNFTKNINFLESEITSSQNMLENVSRKTSIISILSCCKKKI